MAKQKKIEVEKDFTDRMVDKLFNASESVVNKFSDIINK